MSSRLLDDLCSFRDAMYSRDASYRYSHDINAFSPVQYDTIYLEQVFGRIKHHLDKEHIEKTKVCYGLSMAIKNSDRQYHPDKGDFSLCCSCGVDWIFPNIYLTIRYHNLDFEDLVTQINLEIREYNRDKGIFRRFVEIDERKYDVPLKYKHAITSLEIL